MSFLAEHSLNGTVGMPVSVPQVCLRAQSPALTVARFTLARGQVLVLPYVGLHFISFVTLGFTGKVNTSMPTVYAGLYYQNGRFADALPARPIVSIGLDAPGVASATRQKTLTFEAPGEYRVMLVNNHASSAVQALLTGVAYIGNVGTE